MKIVIEIEPKEIAALVVAIQGRREVKNVTDESEDMKKCSSQIEKETEEYYAIIKASGKNCADNPGFSKKDLDLLTEIATRGYSHLWASASQ